MTLNLQQDAQEFRAWLVQNIAAYAAQDLPDPVTALVAIYNYDQSGWIALDFNTDDPFHYDGDVSPAAWDDLFERLAWAPFVEASGPTPMTLIEADGARLSLPASDITDDFLSGHLGRMIAYVLAAAWSDGLFAPLSLRPGFVVLIEDFNGNWGWHAKEVSGKLHPTEGPYP